MSFQRLVKPIYLLQAQPVTGSVTVSSSQYNIQDLNNPGLMISWTGTLTGTISILASADTQTFYPLTFNPALGQPAGSAGGYLVGLNEIPFWDIQFQLVNASGTGTITVALCGKPLE